MEQQLKTVEQNIIPSEIIISSVPNSEVQIEQNFQITSLAITQSDQQNSAPFVQAQIIQNDVMSEESDNESINNTSDTSSYASDNEHKEEAKEQNHHVEDKNIDMIDEFEENTISSYAKFKTQNEIELDQIDKYAPKMPQLDDLDDILEFGIIKKYIEDGQSHVVLVEPLNPLQIYDLDNICCLKNKQVVGFVLDLVGQINQAVYSVKIYPQYIEKLKSQSVEVKNQLMDAKIFLVAKSLKIINATLPVIMSKKGCDASNMFDEELAEHEREYSDDEKEKEAKRARKNKRKQLRQGPNVDQDIEEGEIEEEQILSKRRHHNEKDQHHRHNKDFNNNKKRYYEDQKYQKPSGQQIPMYSTNFAVNQQQQQNSQMMPQQIQNPQLQQHQQYPYCQNQMQLGINMFNQQQMLAQQQTQMFNPFMMNYNQQYQQQMPMFGQQQPNQQIHQNTFMDQSQVQSQLIYQNMMQQQNTSHQQQQQLNMQFFQNQQPPQ